ncbi:hypothetical protein BpHYR1_019971 [Brachionus plicatilis]|uniref:Uncharacterized protein n=1 Tax=Brachionus plicatilis TaxID=10195 RepID=A0A3M7PRJ1_BRAPC|nr:hypothetical protein BpHYR1_019971 [Brachionus plicatilis]
MNAIKNLVDFQLDSLLYEKFKVKLHSQLSLNLKSSRLDLEKNSVDSSRPSRFPTLSGIECVLVILMCLMNFNFLNNIVSKNNSFTNAFLDVFCSLLLYYLI